MITEKQIKSQLKKVNDLSFKLTREHSKFNQMCEKYYGKENYNDHDEDEIIDCLDYGQGTISFEDFDRIMREINIKNKE